MKRIEGDKVYDPRLSDDLEAHVGAEYLALKNLPVRAGIYNQRNSGVVKNESHVFVTVGVGLRTPDGNWGADMYIENSDIFSPHSRKVHRRAVGIFYRFGPERPNNPSAH